jgi:polyhydroxyalkanoate synthesis regulator phasin
MTDEQRRPNDLGDNLREGVRTVAGILGALKDAVEDSFDELRERGDLSPEKAREAARSTMRRAQEEMEQMRESFFFANRRDIDDLRAEIDALRARVAILEERQSGPSEPGFPIDNG